MYSFIRPNLRYSLRDSLARSSHSVVLVRFSCLLFGRLYVCRHEDDRNEEERERHTIPWSPPPVDDPPGSRHRALRTGVLLPFAGGGRRDQPGEARDEGRSTLDEDDRKPADSRGLGGRRELVAARLVSSSSGSGVECGVAPHEAGRR